MPIDMELPTAPVPADLSWEALANLRTIGEQLEGGFYLGTFS